MGKHKTKPGKIKVHGTFCAQKGCRFYGERAAQGVCYSSPPKPYLKYIKRVERHAYELVEGTLQGCKTKNERIKHLKSALLCTWMNGEFSLDECVRLRGENAVLKSKLQRRGGEG